MPGLLSTSEIDRAGRALRGHEGPLDAAAPTVTSGLATLERYRREHALPMQITLLLLAAYADIVAETAGPPVYRIKTRDRTIDKLRRYPSMRLSQMDDVAGARLVLPDLLSVATMSRHIHHAFSARPPIDYNERPKNDGYRAVHLVVEIPITEEGASVRLLGDPDEQSPAPTTRRIEIQLRTERQQRWAQAVEDAEPMTGHNVKDGAAPEELMTYFRLAAERLAREDRDMPRDEELEVRFAIARRAVLPFYSP
jgi:ppGpp synthetase/RelA/SpoT-type nucleotidyltranferase